MKKLIEQLRRLDLSTYPEGEIKKLISQVGQIGFMTVIFHPGKELMRARPNFNGERFHKKSDFSFKPQRQNTTYQRASTPNWTMFYATTLPEKMEPEEYANMRVTGVFESLPALRDKISSTYQKISFGKWIVKEDLTLIAIFQEERFKENSSYLRELDTAFREFSKNAPPDMIERSHLLFNFLACEFSKENIRGDYDYMISALFTELMTSNGFDGVLYPSVPLNGKGINIALTPEATNKLDLIVAGECSIYKRKDHTIVGNDAIVKLDGNEQEFELKEIENHQKECLEKLGFESLNELLIESRRTDDPSS